MWEDGGVPYVTHRLHGNLDQLVLWRGRGSVVHRNRRRKLVRWNRAVRSRGENSRTKVQNVEADSTARDPSAEN
jgi:hypothetical protein